MQTTANVIAEGFCAALDAGDWPAVSSLLDPECEYHFRGEVTAGIDIIVGSYRTIDEWVHETFESVHYESHVELRSDDAALITFRDQMDHGEHHLDFRCQQLIQTNRHDLIRRITHIDLEGEPEKVIRFNAACGVVKPQ